MIVGEKIPRDRGMELTRQRSVSPDEENSGELGFYVITGCILVIYLKNNIGKIK